MESTYKIYTYAKINSKQVVTLGVQYRSLKNISVSFLKLFVDRKLIVKAKDKVEVFLYNQKEYKIFTGWIDSFYFENNSQILVVKDGNTEFLNTNLASSYRKEKAKNILTDCLAKAGITNFSITVPDITIDRFLISDVCQNTIKRLIETIYVYGFDQQLIFFFDKDNIFHFGTLNDTGKNQSEVFNFDKNIVIKTLQGGFETLALPIRHSQQIIYNHQTIITSMTMLNVFPKYSSLEVYW